MGNYENLAKNEVMKNLVINISEKTIKSEEFNFTLEQIENVNYLKNVDQFTIEAYGLVELENAIIVGGISKEQYFLLLPPKDENEKWKYWKFANWMAGEQPFENLKEYFEDVFKFIIKRTKKQTILGALLQEVVF